MYRIVVHVFRIMDRTNSMTRTADEAEAGVIAFRAPAELLERVDATAAMEGTSRSDVARRAVSPAH